MTRSLLVAVALIGGIGDAAAETICTFKGAPRVVMTNDTMRYGDAAAAPMKMDRSLGSGPQGHMGYVYVMRTGGKVYEVANTRARDSLHIWNDAASYDAGKPSHRSFNGVCR